MRTPTLPRRAFLRQAAWATLAMSAVPTRFLQASSTSPARGQVRVAIVGCGRMGLLDLQGVAADRRARIVAVCDLDPRRREAARVLAEKMATERGDPAHPVIATADYRDLIGRADIDALVISTPDHWHALPAIAAARAKKHVYVQKPLTYTIGEAKALRDAVQKTGVVLQVGSQQRSEQPFPAFRPASELARSGRLGRVHTVRIGLGADKPTGQRPPDKPDPIPADFSFDRWLGPAPEQPYFEARVHPQSDYGRPGWITTEDFGLGMITNWGAHHLDIALWALGLENSGPSEIKAWGRFMRDDLSTVHQEYRADLLMPNGSRIILDHGFANGIRFDGEDGWVFCSRGATRATPSDGNTGSPLGTDNLRFSSPELAGPLPADAKRWPASPDHYRDWIGAIVDRRAPIAPVEQGVRSLEACATTWISMKLDRAVRWDPKAESFGSDAEANRWLDRPARKPEFDYRLL